MHDPMLHRRLFLKRSSMLGLAAASGTLLLTSEASAQTTAKKAAAPPEPPPLDPDRVRAFVSAAHRDLDTVRRMLDEQPALVNAAWDWSAGDFESAVGAAAHMGRRDIALELLGRGGRMDLFVAAMLGQLEIVRAVLTVDPAALHVPGAHGIPLIAHARAGGEPAAETLAYLEGLVAAG